MSSQYTHAPRSVRIEQRRHYVVAAGIFILLGFHVGVWAVALPRLADALHIGPGTLGAAVSASAAAGIATLVRGGHLADRFGRRPVLLVGFGGTAAAFALLGQVRSTAMLVGVFVLYGLTVSLIDLGANTIGSDYERVHGRRVMTGLHAGFSLGALLGALCSATLLWAGASHRVVYLLLALVLTLGALAVGRSSLPSWHVTSAEASASSRTPGVWRNTGVLLAIVVVTVAFFGDGALESFLGVFLADLYPSENMLTGIGIGGFHLASLLGRLGAARLEKRYGERRLLFGAGTLAAAGMITVVTTTNAVVVVGGLLAVGAAVAPVVPMALSLAGRSVPGHSGRAVAVTTAAGYSAFIVSPALIGGIADATSLRAALSVLIATSLTVAALSARWPTHHPGRPRPIHSPRPTGRRAARRPAPAARRSSDVTRTRRRRRLCPHPVPDALVAG